MSTDPERYVLAAWKLPLIVAALICSIVGGFYLGGAGLGLAVGAMAASSVVVWAARNPPTPTIVPPVATDGRVRLLLVVDGPVGAVAVEKAALTVAAAGGPAEVFVVVPLRLGLIDRWTSATDRARSLAEGRLAMTISAFERAGVATAGALGDEGPVQAAEDALRTYPATVVALLATGGSETADILRERLRVSFVRLRTGRRSAPPGRRIAAPGRLGTPAPWAPDTPGRRTRTS